MVRIGPNKQSVTDQLQNSAIQETERVVGRVGLYQEITWFSIAYEHRQSSENAQINSVCRPSISPAMAIAQCCCAPGLSADCRTDVPPAVLIS
eukprot:3164216-Rhodomonas_salina.1